MLTEIENYILAAAQAIYDAWGWFGVAALLVFENASGITPSEVILGLAGWMLIEKHQLSPAMIPVGGFYAAIGSVIGASIAYWAARLGGRPLVDRLAWRLRIKPAQIDRAEAHFQRWGVGLVLVGRVIPGIRTMVSIPAGLARMPFHTFFAATFTGAYIWCTLLIGAGYALGHEWARISGYLKNWLPYLVAGGILALSGYYWLTHRAPKLEPAPVRVDDDWI